MHCAMIISRVLVASVAVWRLSHLFFEGTSYRDRSRFLVPKPANMFANRFLDCVCWLTMWLFAQTALWVASGLVAVFIGWLIFSSLSRLFIPSDEITKPSSREPRDSRELREGSVSTDLSCFSAECGLQANHG